MTPKTVLIPLTEDQLALLEPLFQALEDDNLSNQDALPGMVVGQFWSGGMVAGYLDGEKARALMDAMGLPHVVRRYPREVQP